MSKRSKAKEDEKVCEGCGAKESESDIEFTLENPSEDDGIDEGYNWYCYDCASQFI